MKKLLMVLFGALILFSCEKPECEYLNSEDLADVELKKKGKGHSEPVIVSVPLKADFTVWLESAIPNESCAPDYALRFTMVGNGNMSHLGKMTTRMEFCGNPVPVGPYGNGFGKFVAANGDELYFDLELGEIIWNEEDTYPYYLTRFNDKVYFTGGTGRFEEATGYFMTNAYVHYPDAEDDVWHTDFFSYGILNMVKGKRK